VVVGGENNCWPFRQPFYRTSDCKEWGVVDCKEMMPSNVSRVVQGNAQYLWANSGSIITRASSLAPLMSYLQRVVEENTRCLQDDQALVSAAFRFQDKFNAPIAIRLDHDGIFAASARDMCPVFRLMSQKVHLADNDLAPAAIHYNGGGKACLVEHLKRFVGDTDASASSAAPAFTWDGRRHELTDVCGTPICQTSNDVVRQYPGSKHPGWAASTPESSRSPQQRFAKSKHPALANRRRPVGGDRASRTPTTHLHVGGRLGHEHMQAQAAHNISNEFVSIRGVARQVCEHSNCIRMPGKCRELSNGSCMFLETVELPAFLDTVLKPR